MKSNYCTYCPTQTQCRYIKADGICEKAAAFEAGRRDKEKELPKNAIIIDGEVYEFDHYVTEDDIICNHCDLHGQCLIMFDDKICSIFGLETEHGCFKKKGGEK